RRPRDPHQPAQHRRRPAGGPHRRGRRRRLDRGRDPAAERRRLRDAGALRAAQRAGAPPPRGGEDLSRRAAGSRRPEERLSRAAPPRPRLERCPPCCASSASPVPWPRCTPRSSCARCSRRARLAVPFLIGHATDTVAAAVGGETDTGTAVRTVLLIAGAVLAAELAVTVISNVGGWFGDEMSNRMRTI